MEESIRETGSFDSFTSTLNVKLTYNPFAEISVKFSMEAGFSEMIWHPLDLTILCNFFRSSG